MSGQLRWGILGTGQIAHIFARDLTLSGFAIAAAGSRSLERARAFIAGGSYGIDFDIAHAHGSYEELVADPTVDVVYIATPNTLHYEHAMLALAAGKHVLLEKPFAMNAAEARAIFDLAAAADLVVLEAMWTRWLPHMVRIREILAFGGLGRVRSVLANNGEKSTTDPRSRLLDPALGGGAMLDLGIYPLSFASDVLGAPSTVTALANPASTGVDGQTAVLLGYPEGQLAVIHTGFEARGSRTAAIIGTDARIEIDPVWYEATSFTVRASNDTVIEQFESDMDGRGMQFQAAELERLVRQGQTASTVLPPAETIAILETLDQIRAQINQHQP